MKIIATMILAALAISAGSLNAGSTRVKGYYRSNGTYVAPHYRSSPNYTPYDNWSTRGNVNPYTGEVGRRDIHPSYYVPKYRGALSSDEMMQAAAAAGEQRFFASYPELANPAFKPVLYAAAQALLATGRKFSSETEMFAELARLTKILLNIS
jgi:hypothetical protein